MYYTCVYWDIVLLPRYNGRRVVRTLDGCLLSQRKLKVSEESRTPFPDRRLSPRPETFRMPTVLYPPLTYLRPTGRSMSVAFPEHHVTLTVVEVEPVQ